MTKLRIKFDRFAGRFNNNIKYSTLPDLNSDYENVFEAVEKFLNRRSVTVKQITEFYRIESTVLNEDELNELLFKGKNRSELKEIYGGIREAVKYKLVCELQISNYKLQISNVK
ncbi:MAG: hypothetical protein JSS91_07575 [Bacteroidetes bacterium]|nr:hypothetical protein [Bacteroidota bacterium]